MGIVAPGATSAAGFIALPMLWILALALALANTLDFAMALDFAMIFDFAITDALNTECTGHKRLE